MYEVILHHYIYSKSFDTMEEKMNKKGQSGWLIWAVIFLVIAIVAGIFGFGIISGVTYTVAKWLAIIFVILFIVTIIARTAKRA
jgi:uncharacterized membrane protein YtjA (UPF0391 family)